MPASRAHLVEPASIFREAKYSDAECGTAKLDTRAPDLVATVPRFNSDYSYRSCEYSPTILCSFLYQLPLSMLAHGHPPSLAVQLCTDLWWSMLSRHCQGRGACIQSYLFMTQCCVSPCLRQGGLGCSPFRSGMHACSQLSSHENSVNAAKPIHGPQTVQEVCTVPRYTCASCPGCMGTASAYYLQG